MQEESRPVVSVYIIKASGGATEMKVDHVVSEQPLEIIIKHGSNLNRRSFPLAITMRTPGDDLSLATGFLFTENIIHQSADIISHQRLSEDRMIIELHPDLFFNEAEMHRNVYTSSSCGVCGKASLERVRMSIPYVLKKGNSWLAPHDVYTWPDKIEAQQSVFKETGGIHAVGLFDRGELLALKEDVGRHNAMDKLIGEALMNDLVPMSDKAVMVSGRASFELVQKALMAGIPVLAAVGAPSSLAIELADDHNMTLMGFVRNGQCNIYCGGHRLTLED